MNPRHPVIEILLATYNGAAFLNEQLASAFAQNDVVSFIHARDDGSHDRTPDILAEWASQRPAMRILPTDTPTGSAKGNFHKLLLASTEDYVAFCDQDDVWLPNKLSHPLERMRQLEATHGSSTPILVSTDLQVTNETLQVIAPSLWQMNGLKSTIDPPLGQLLSENTVTGCTALLNRALVQRMAVMPPAAHMHDHWAALVAASTGIIAAIPNADILYRQHGGNVLGAVKQRSPLQKIRRLVGKDAAAERTLQYRKDRAQAQSLLELHSHAMSTPARGTVAAFIALEDMDRVERIKTMHHYGLWRSGTARKLAAISDTLRS